jgi:hypothetical protein
MADIEKQESAPAARDWLSRWFEDWPRPTRSRCGAPDQDAYGEGAPNAAAGRAGAHAPGTAFDVRMW